MIIFLSSLSSSLLVLLYFSLCLFFQAWVANFERPRMNANSLLASPTGLSPYLRFGCLSCRLFYFKLTDLYRKVSLQLLQCRSRWVNLFCVNSFGQCVKYLKKNLKTDLDRFIVHLCIFMCFIDLYTIHPIQSRPMWVTLSSRYSLQQQSKSNSFKVWK